MEEEGSTWKTLQEENVIEHATGHQVEILWNDAKSWALPKHVEKLVVSVHEEVEYIASWYNIFRCVFINKGFLLICFKLLDYLIGGLKEKEAAETEMKVHKKEKPGYPFLPLPLPIFIKVVRIYIPSTQRKASEQGLATQHSNYEYL